MKKLTSENIGAAPVGTAASVLGTPSQDGSLLGDNELLPGGKKKKKEDDELTDESEVKLTLGQLKKLVYESEDSPASNPELDLDKIEAYSADIINQIEDWRNNGMLEYWQYSQLFDLVDGIFEEIYKAYPDRKNQ